MNDYDLDCPLAYNRLIQGMPTLTSSSKSIAETVQFFITLMDSLKLEQYAVDEIFPQLSDLGQSLGRLGKLDRVKSKIKEWLVILNKMRFCVVLTIGRRMSWMPSKFVSYCLILRARMRIFKIHCYRGG
jgi:archaellum biogenesis protein FlaJ (TadC family)